MISIKRKVSFYDCDPAGIIFYSKIFDYCHSAYEELINSFKLNESYWNNEEYIVPIIKSEATYSKAIKYGDVITIELNVTQIKSSSFELEYICKNENGEVTNTVMTVHVFVDRKNWKKINIPEVINKKLNAV
ncbi:MAG: acyl-CoA thioesterase [Ignavibacteriales bacterium]|nr:MAG: acyl-CoA thioesterase [Ignavibacteriales bacterium]